VAVVPSPKDQLYEAMTPSGSYEAEPSKRIHSPNPGAVGERVKEATGGRLLGPI